MTEGMPSGLDIYMSKSPAQQGSHNGRRGPPLGGLSRDLFTPGYLVVLEGLTSVSVHLTSSGCSGGGMTKSGNKKLQDKT